VDIALDAGDAAELAEMLRSSATGSPATRTASAPRLRDFVGSRACGTRQLRDDLDRFAFLLGGDDGQALFGS
jgi:hypothetical protein